MTNADKHFRNATDEEKLNTTRYTTDCFYIIGRLKKRSQHQQGGIKMTWGDKIRAMTDEEMADEFSYPGCPKQSTPEICRKHTGDCKQCWLDYLKQEVEK